MISESLARSRRLYFLGRFGLGLLAVLSPVLAFGLVSLLVDGHAKREYFEAVAQILPVLLLALAIEQRYFTRNQPIPKPPEELKLGDAEIKTFSRWYSRAARVYAFMVLIALGVGEWIAVEVLATGHSSTHDLKRTAGSLAAGFTALIVSALVGTKQPTD